MEINWNGSSLFYEKAGNGVEILLLFHGFGQDHKVFSPLISAIEGRYTCYSFDLFYHGQSRWANPAEPLKAEHWKDLIELFLEREKITRFSVLGFSIGARLALATFEISPQSTSAIFLLAPDGIRNHFFYQLATSFSLNRFVFRTVIRSENLFQWISSAARLLKIADPALLRFAESQMNSKAKRLKVYNTWLLFRGLKFNESRLAQRINQNNTAVYLFLARNDAVITEKGLRKFISLLRSPVVEIVNARHNQLVSVVAGMFLKLVKGRSENRP